MEVAGFVLSIISMLLSIGVAICEANNSYRINKITLESQHFDALYKDYLIIKLPLARKKLTFNLDGKLTGVDEICDVMNSIRINSTYFAYADKSFYDKLKKELSDFEDYLMNTSNKKIMGTDQGDVYAEIEKRISVLYDILLSKYTGIDIGKTKKLKAIKENLKSLVHN